MYGYDEHRTKKEKTDSFNPNLAVVEIVVTGSAAGGGAAVPPAEVASGTTSATISAAEKIGRRVFEDNASPGFFFTGANRESAQTPALLKAFLLSPGRASLPWHRRLADFQVIIYLARIIGLDYAKLVAEAVATKTTVPAAVIDKIKSFTGPV